MGQAFCVRRWFTRAESTQPHRVAPRTLRVRLLLSIAAACGGFAAPVLAGPTLPPLRAGGGWVTAQQTNLKKGETEPQSFSSRKTEGATTLGRRKKRHKQNKPPNRRAFPYKTAILYPLRVVYKTARAERSRFLYKIPVLYAKNSFGGGGRRSADKASWEGCGDRISPAERWFVRRSGFAVPRERRRSRPLLLD